MSLLHRSVSRGFSCALRSTILAFLVLPLSALASLSTGNTGSGTAFENSQPTLAMRWVFAVNGVYPSRNGSPNEEAYIAELRLIPYDSQIPTNFVACEGQLLSINSFPAAYSLVGTIYGGNGITTFGIPDLRGRVVMHEGQGAGLTNRTLGSRSGGEFSVLGTSQLPAHTHTITGGTTDATGSGVAVNNMQPFTTINMFMHLSGTAEYLGTVRFFAGNFAPAGSAFLDGQTLSIASYPNLFARIGTAFGGDGSTTFRLPDMRGRTIVGTGTGPGLDAIALGASGGTETITLSEANLPAHTHGYGSGDTTGSTGSGQAHNTRQPYVGLTAGISLTGAVNALGNLTSPALGEVRFSASSVLPNSNWAAADGSTLPIASHTALSNLLGTSYGGDGSSTLGLPDLRSRSASSVGQGGGLTNRTLGQTWGAHEVTLTTANLPVHSHTYTDPNATPTDISLSNSSVNQSGGTNATIGTLSTTDADSGDTHTYTLVAGTGDTDNGSFNIDGSTLRANDAGALSAGSKSVRIQTDDGKGGTLAKQFSITVVDDVAPPVPSTPDLDAGSDTGSSNTDDITSDTTPTFTGTAETGAFVTVFIDVNSNNAYDAVGDTLVGIATATGGAYSITPFSPQAEGTLTVKAVASDGSNTSVATSAFSITIDTTAPVITSGTTTSGPYGGTPSYTVSASGGATSFGGSGLTTGLGINGTSGIITGTAGAIGTANATINATDAAGNTGSGSLAITINPAGLSITGLTGDNKAYDGTTAGTAAGTATLSGIVGADDVILGGSPVFTFASANVGTGITINTTGYTITGTDSGNYTLTQPTLAGDISGAQLTIVGLTGDNKVYDGTTASTATGTATIAGIIGADNVILGGSPVFTFASANVGTGITINTTGYTITGTDSGNYTLTQPTLAADITAASLTIVGITGDNKAYDGTTAGTATGTATLSGIIGADDVILGGSPTFTFTSANVGTGITVNTTGYTISGTDSGNYTLTQPTLAADITAAELSVVGLTGDNKVYDTDTAATATGTATLSGLIGADDVSLGGSPTFTFASANVGTGITINTTGYTITGTDSGNYTLTQPTLAADITAASLTVSGLVAQNKVYDANTDATIDDSGMNLVGLQGSDVLTIDDSGAGATFADKNVGTGKAVTLTGAVLAGSAAGNYTLTLPTDLTADITAAPLTLTGVVADNKVYDGNTNASLNLNVPTNGSSFPQFDNVQGSDSVGYNGGSATGTFAQSDVGTGIAVTIAGVTLTGTDAGNYTFTQPTGVTANITAKELTVTAESKSTPYGDPVAALTYTVTGFISGEDENNISGEPTLTTDALRTSPVSRGGYTITIALGSLTATNYSFSLVNGTYSVNPGYHFADTDRDNTISLAELLRVIELYNYREGTVRLGSYSSNDANTDRYEPGGDGTRILPHTADYNGDGKISLIELTRMILLYNTRDGSTRTGAYYYSPSTEDGFAPGRGER